MKEIEDARHYNVYVLIMNKLRRFFTKLYIEIVNSIAFYPILISIGFLVFSFIVMGIEYQPVVMKIKGLIQIVLVQGTDNARLILGTILGSIFSLMVFSFSMVMVVLNSASSTLSPRVIPGLITQKAHQVVLGVYLGTIIYSLILIINIQSPEAEYQIPTLGILFSMLFAILCLAMFVYFIHSISRSIQVDNILNGIFKNTAKQLDESGTIEPVPDFPNTSSWHSIYTHRSGYMKKIQKKSLANVCEKHDLTISVSHELGFFFVQNYPFLKVSKKVDKTVEEEIRNCFIFYIEEHVTDHYLFGFKQISEIAVKAMSPGINDPGTAIKAIDMLSILFIKKMRINEKSYHLNADGKLNFFVKSPGLEYLLYTNLTPIREYGKNDANVMIQILESLKNLAFSDKENRKYQKVLSKYIQSMIRSCDDHISNDLDREQVDQMVESINYLLGEEYTVQRHFGEVNS